MIRFLSLICPLLLVTIVNGQSNPFLVLDEISHEPVKYATIKLKAKPGGVVANSRGEFYLTGELNDTVVISSISYDSLQIAVGDIKTPLYLKRSNKMLQEVVLTRRTFEKPLVVGWSGNLKNFVTFPWGSFNSQDEFAQRIFLPDSTANYLILSVTLPIKKIGFSRSLIIRIYEEDTCSGLPGEQIFQKLISVAKLKNGKAYASLESDNVSVSSFRSIYIGVTWDPDRQPGDMGPGIILTNGSEEHVLSRTLLNRDYSWFKYDKVKTAKNDYSIGGTFSIELAKIKE